MANSYRLRELKIEINRECPLRCLHCSSNGAPQAREKLDSSKVADLIREFADMGGKTVAISGGEPLAYKDLSLILDVCHSLGIRPDLYTSGIFSNGLPLSSISKDTLELFSQTRTRVIFSLHGARAKTHDALTQLIGSFDTTMESIQRTVAAGIAVEVHVVPTAINFGEIADMMRQLAFMDIKKVSWLRFVPQGRGEINRNVLQLSRDQLRQLADARVELQHIYPEVQIRAGSPFNILCTQSPTPCKAGLSVLTICSDGRAVPCDAFKQFRVRDKFGNILEHSLSEVWEKSDLLNSVRQLQQSRCNSPCASCPAYSRCASGCLAQKAIAAGMLTNGRDPECLLERAETESEEIEAVAVC
jgi:radical SAM protein with 4Fe4S-binding SPASM domain